MSYWEEYFNAWLAWHEAVLRYQAELQSLMLTKDPSEKQLQELRKEVIARRDAMKSAAATVDQQAAPNHRKQNGTA
ncbi:hypothetical protein GCM10027277_55440 [Pseudoduganella ginsengisoli]|uniref:Poly(3-hydroxyalkanoate) polymerase subunit PhaE n=1 Tax=Pseudoduganella ginsengisoli TaxID=1462440 RepID=A0A6L6Q5M4_9BURK|nr:hypothetical protein [Pseudoduganella ginsengisoli]MTW04980.1 hypothetical protein [Pseudoduganella ginsengisoli]